MVTFLVEIYLVIMIHELGHAAAAEMLRLPLSSIDMGMGVPIASFRFHCVRYRLRIVPWGGSIKLCWRSRTWSKNFAVAAAGPLANLVAGLVTLPFSADLAWLNALACAWNCIPAEGSDGYLMRTFWRERSKPLPRRPRC